MKMMRIRAIKHQKQEFEGQTKNKRNSNHLNSRPNGSQAQSPKIATISNREFCDRRQRLTKAIKEDIDSRDRQFLLPFSRKFNIEKYHQEQGAEGDDGALKFQQKEYLGLKKAVFGYLSDVCETVTSISFKYLSKGDLSENQAKAFASKTILSNIQSVFSDIKAKFCSFQPVDEVNQIMEDLTLSIDQYLSSMFSQLARHYPQAPPAGATARMKEVILGINRSQDENNDLIFANKIDIEKYTKTDKNSPEVLNTDFQDYNGFVMETLNKAINITAEVIEKDETIAQRHQHFAESLFAFANYKDKIKDKSKEITENQLFSYLFNGSTDSQSIQQLKQAKQDWKEQARKQHKYGIAQKIPTHVKPFTKMDIKQGKFSINNSSVLRVMTKWAEYLEDIFEKPQIEIQQRLYDVKNFKYQLQSFTQERKTQIKYNLQEEYKKVKEQLQKIKKANTLFQSYLLGQPQKGSTFLKRFTQVREASSQINAITIEFTRKYLCILIHHLIKAGQWTNLIVFRVGDLLRSKLQCSEKAFINIIKTLTLLDESKEMEGKFKLVRIKNKLNERDNNVLINYMFMGKVQCELQLSIQKMDRKDQNYYAFCHFLYELTRGKLGVITQLANIVCQHDPIISASKEAYYRPKFLENQKKMQAITHKIHKKNQNIYKCMKCRLLRIKQNVDLFRKEENICNQCIVRQLNPQIKLYPHDQDKKFQKYLIAQLDQGKLKKILNYGDIQEEKYIISINNGKMGSKMKLYKTWKPRQQVKLFMIQINEKILAEFDKQYFDYSNIDYFDIIPKIKKKQQLKQLTYVLNEEINQQVFKSLQINEKLFQKLGSFLESFQRFRVEKNLIKLIKFKNEIIDIRNYKIKHQILDEIVKIYRDNRPGKKLFYKKYKTLEWENIIGINSTDLNLSQVPQIMKQGDYQTIDLSRNNFEQIQVENYRMLNKLIVDQNNLKQIKLDGNTNLAVLSINQNQLQQLDLSNNTNLTHLYLNQNYIQQIDLSNNINLTVASLDQNQLQQINLGDNTNLIYLYLNQNQLQQVDIRSNINLLDLRLEQNQLQQIDLSNNINLTSLYLNKNQLQSIDLSNNTNLINLSLNQNQLQQIDISNNKNLAELSLEYNQLQQIDLTNNTNLTTLYLSQNQLQQINLSNNTNLSILYLNQNQLQQIDLSTNTNLKTLSLSQNQLQQIDLSNNVSLKKIYLSSNQLQKILLFKLLDPSFSFFDDQFSQQCFVLFLRENEDLNSPLSEILSGYQRIYIKDSESNKQKCNYVFLSNDQFNQQKGYGLS